MRKPKWSPRTGNIQLENTYEAEGLEVKLRKMLENKEPIPEDWVTIYTEKSKGVEPQFNPRTDRWDIAMQTVGKIRYAENAEQTKRLEAMKEKSTAEESAENGSATEGATSETNGQQPS